MFRRVIRFFDLIEDSVRIALSHYPIVYSCIGSVGIILLWKGVWEMAEYVPFLFGPISALIGVSILLLTGLLVSFFIGDSIILSGLTREKKLVERTEKDVQSEQATMEHVLARLGHIEQALTQLTSRSPTHAEKN